MSKIYVNAGHGGSDSGAVGIGGRMEKDDNLRYAAAVADKLRVAGHDVNFERDGDYLIPVGEIARRANAWGADLFVSFHRNSFNGVAQG
ncbi:MAG: N-acetylmuramoyl-L-alanine amidase, partial [Christensenella sp.]